jgi:hypothetical protein
MRVGTYAEWAALLDSFAGGSEDALVQMRACSFEPDAGTAQRFYTRVNEAYMKRKQRWLDKFHHASGFRQIKTPGDFEIVIRDAKVNLAPIATFINLPGLPVDLRDTLKKDLNDFIAEMKSSMKDNIGKLSSGREQMLLQLNNFSYSQPVVSEPIPPTGRKIIF